MFQFTAFALPGLYIQPGVTRRWGFPIRTSPDQYLFASSPELIAGYRVLRRLSMPRHPPCTLKNLTTFIDHRHSKNKTSTVDRRSPNVAGLLQPHSTINTPHSTFVPRSHRMLSSGKLLRTASSMTRWATATSTCNLTRRQIR